MEEGEFVQLARYFCSLVAWRQEMHQSSCFPEKALSLALQYPYVSVWSASRLSSVRGSSSGRQAWSSTHGELIWSPELALGFENRQVLMVYLRLS